jgi:hypothetical protein
MIAAYNKNIIMIISKSILMMEDARALKQTGLHNYGPVKDR